MNFTTVVGTIDKKIVKLCEDKLSNLFVHLSRNYTNKDLDGFGGDPFIFALLYSGNHCLTEAIETAATDGKFFYWNPTFLKSADYPRLRLTSMHESFHNVWMHPERIGKRNSFVWNMAVDYRVNYDIFDDLKSRNLNGPALFTKHIGRIFTLKDIVDFIEKKKSNKKTEQKTGIAYFADPNLPKEYLVPEVLYDYLMSILPPEMQQSSSSPGEGKLVDEHMTSQESQEETAKKIADAIQMTKQLAGNIPAGYEDQLMELSKPRIALKDALRLKIQKSKAGNSKNDWTKFKSRPLFLSLLVPKRKSYQVKFGCLLDTSGSMTQNNISDAISQLQSLDPTTEGLLVPADAQIYWDKISKLKSVDKSELGKIKVVGRGGTKFGAFFKEYEKYFGKCDFLVVLTDGFLSSSDMATMVNPGIDVFWIITNDKVFKPPFGRVFQLD